MSSQVVARALIMHRAPRSHKSAVCPQRDKISPKRTQLFPSKRISCTCSIG